MSRGEEPLQFFPRLISQPFSDGLAVAFGFATAACLIAAVASLLRGGRYVHDDRPRAQAIPSPAPVAAAVDGTPPPAPANGPGTPAGSGPAPPAPPPPHPRSP
ncbi:hypothetical protein OIU91_36885 [Streptomyces sp. NBC_01456]|uniref:hypothetical protein n=1 Tax=unclassified Streptomyces TaxID=2593676 RepID=UPI002E30B0A4|nr:MULTISPECIES: hypothetical protein [unclassified Streptomyces]